MKNSLILIPSYEPDSLLIDVVNGLLKEDFHVVVINDGSSEEYNKIFDVIKPFVTYFSYPNNQGKGHALKIGYKIIKENFSDFEYVITADGDGQHSLKDIIRIHEELNKRNELVFGVREFDETAPIKSKIGNGLSRFNRSLLTKECLRDDQCGLRGFPIRYLDELIKISGERYEYEMNQIVLFNLKRYPIYEIKVETIYLNSNKRSHFSPVKDTLRIHSRILSHSFLALLSNAFIIFFIVFLLDHNFNILGATSLSYLGGFILYLALSLIIYRSKNVLSRVLKEVIFSLIKMGMTIGLLFLFTYYLKIPHQVIASLGVILVSFINVPLAILFHKIKETRK